MLITFEFVILIKYKNPPYNFFYLLYIIKYTLFIIVII